MRNWEWLEGHEELAWTLAAFSVVIFLASLATVPWLAAAIPADYFSGKTRHRPHPTTRHPIIRILLLLLKNCIGGALLLAGVVMLVLPGQGIITMLVGMMLLDFPGKYRLERWLVGRPHVLRSINWLRKRRGRDPLDIQ